jgi:hypothetical protein
LVNGLSERNISATFYVTPNVARKRPDELKYLEKNGQRIGVRVHCGGCSCYISRARELQQAIKVCGVSLSA